MGKLFRIEMKKLWKSTAMRVMVIVTVVLSIISVASYAAIEFIADDYMGEALGIDGYTAMNALLLDNSDSMLFAVLLIAILIGGDFSARTLQMQVSAGFSRFKIILSRYISTLIAYCIFYITYMTFFVGGVTVVLGFGRPVTEEFIGQTILQIFMSLFMSAAMLAMYVFVCFLFKSTGATIGVCLPFLLVGTTILQALIYAIDICKKVLSFTPFGQILLITEELDTLGYVKFFSVGAVWIIGILVVTFVTFRKAELK